MNWLDQHKPEDVASCISHGDWRIDNMVFDLGQKRLVGVLDWELATVGDPLMDLGSALAYWVDKDDVDDITKAAGTGKEIGIKVGKKITNETKEAKIWFTKLLNYFNKGIS